MNVKRIILAFLLLPMALCIAARARAQNNSQAALNQSLSWLVTKLTAYSEDGSNTEDLSNKPHEGSNYDGSYVIFKKRTNFHKPDFGYDLVSGVIIMAESSNVDFLRYNISLARYRQLNFSQKYEVRRNSEWVSKDRIITKYFLAFQFIDHAEFDPSVNVLRIYTTGNFVRMDNDDRDNSISMYFNINAETNLLQRINRAINTIRNISHPREAY